MFPISPVRGYAVNKDRSSLTPILPPAAIALLATAVHGPLLLMQLPARSAGAGAQMFLAQHYASDWMNPWNEKWFAGFSQTTHAPLTQQWVGLLSHLFGTAAAYMIVQLLVVVFLTVAVYRFAQIWTDDRAASLASIGSIFLGSLAMLVYRVGALPATAATALVLYGVVFLYRWCHRGKILSALASVALLVAAATADHITAIFGIILFSVPAIIFAGYRDDSETGASPAGADMRGLIILAVTAVISGFILAPFWTSAFSGGHRLVPANESPNNLLMHLSSALSDWLIPMGFLVLALPLLFLQGFSERRFRPLFLTFYVALIVGLGATTPVARLVLGRFFTTYSVLEFTFWATLLALPILGWFAAGLIERHAVRAIIALCIAAVLTFSAPLAWITFHPAISNPFRTEYIVNFLNRDGHNNFRYLTLGFGSQFAEVTRGADASTVDGISDFGSILPEEREYGVSHLDNARQYGSAGMEALRAVLKHANQYGLKYIFIRDRYYEPLIAFAGWRQVETYENGNVTLWSKEDVPPVKQTSGNSGGPALTRFVWGVFPVLFSLIGLLLVLLAGERREQDSVLPVPVIEPIRVEGGR